jgi:hypothetical protein
VYPWHLNNVEQLAKSRNSHAQRPFNPTNARSERVLNPNETADKQKKSGLVRPGIEPRPVDYQELGLAQRWAAWKECNTATGS